MRRVTWFSAGFGAACLLCCYRPGGLPAALCAALLSALSLTAFLFTRLRANEHPDLSLLPVLRRTLLKVGRWGTAFFLGGALAFLWFSGYTALFRAPAAELAGTEQIISATVTSYPEETSIGGCSLTLRLDGGFRAPDLLLYGSEDWADLTPGDRMRCTVRLRSSDVLYGDETTYYTARGVFLLGYCDEQPSVQRAESIPVRYWPKLCAHRLKQGIYAAFDDTAAPLAAAVTLGDKSGLSEQTHAALSRSGIMHTAVVSGMHICFLSSLLHLLCRGRAKAILLLVPILFFYALMAGGTPSALRAVIVQTVFLVGPIVKRDDDLPTSLGLALFILLVQNPYAAASVSLQLSFAAVVGIHLCASPLAEGMLTPVRLRLRGAGRFGRCVLALYRLVTSGAAVSLSAMLLTVPLIVLYFGRIPLISPLTNIFTLWAATCLMISALVIGTLAVFLPGLAAIPGFAAGLLGHYLSAVTSFVGRFPLASPDGENPYFLIWLLSVYLFLGCVLFSRRRGRQALLSAGCLVLLLAAAVGFNSLSVRRAQLTLTALDVGQGASTLIRSGSGSALVDCGGNSADSPGDLAADRLAAAGTTGLDALIFTHLDDDHFNGAAQLFWRLEIDRVYVSRTSTDQEHMTALLDLAAAEGAEVIFVTEVLTISLGETTLTLYPPLGGGSSNEEGLFVLCSCDGFDALITGDADAFVEKMLIKYHPIPDLELLLVGHHGSKYSTDPEFLAATRPELSILSVGHNSFGHPAAEVLARLDAAGSRVCRTDEQGDITVRVRSGAVSIH